MQSVPHNGATDFAAPCSATSFNRVSLLPTGAVDSVVHLVCSKHVSQDIAQPLQQPSQCSSHVKGMQCSHKCKARPWGSNQLKPTTWQYSGITLKDSHMQSVPQGSTVTLKHCIVMKAIKHLCNGPAPLINTTKSKTEDMVLIDIASEKEP